MRNILRNDPDPKFGFIFMERFQTPLSKIPNYCYREDLKQKVSNIIDLLHKNGIYHGDLHSGNILVNSPDTVVFADFGRVYAPWFTPPLPPPDLSLISSLRPLPQFTNGIAAVVKSYDIKQFQKLFSCRKI